MMELRTAVGQGPLERGRGQGLSQICGEFPAADGPGEHVEKHRQVDELAGQAHIGDVRTPDLIRTDDRQTPDQVRIAAESVGAVGRLTVALDVDEQIGGVHASQNALMVGFDAFAAELGGDAPIAVARVRDRDLLDGVAQGEVGGKVVLALVGVAAPRNAQRATKETDRPDGMRRVQGGDHGTLLADRGRGQLQAFFTTASSIACWPTRRSNSATRTTSALAPRGSVNNSCARSTTTLRHWPSRSAPISCSRHSCAGVLSPRSNSSTTRALYSGSNFRRCRIPEPLSAPWTTIALDKQLVQVQGFTTVANFPLPIEETRQPGKRHSLKDGARQM